ncbi:MAG: cupin domain-containing protein [Yoonia sp.]|uniref:cupin domain-containing protein n=1 Tax=Yoonia sp. TaxID=2212373 RepID=UPI003EF5A3EC
MFMSVVDQTFQQDVATVAAAYWRRDTDTGADAPTGTGHMNGGGDIGFLVTKTALTGQGVLDCAPLILPAPDWALRLDEVAFPVGAIAHRHTHAGAGWRHLVSGELRIEADHHTTVMTTGISWFEPADTPVRAVASQTTGITRFVRCMAIPAAFMDRSTFQLASPDDGNLPRLQVTHRHFDHVVQVDAL